MTAWHFFLKGVHARLVCAVLVNSDTLTANYGVKRSQFTKLTSESYNVLYSAHHLATSSTQELPNQIILHITLIGK